MQLKDHKDPKNPESKYLYLFNEAEAAIVRAAFREHIHVSTKKLNYGSISDYEHEIAMWPDNKKKSKVSTGIGSLINQQLQRFGDRTEEAVQEIAIEGGLPGFSNDYISQRKALGEAALDLLDEINGKIAKKELIAGLEGLPTTQHPFGG